MRFVLVLNIAAVTSGYLTAHRTNAAHTSDGHLVTRWAADVTAENCWREYPRPQMTRSRWLCLNGMWDAAILPSTDGEPANFSEKILVPFPAESYLSGFEKAVQPDERLWYRRQFEVPKDWMGSRILLHFGAVDWATVVKVNGVEVGQHQGGYTPFTLDVTEHVKSTGPNDIIVAVTDPTDTGTQPLGKQRLKPGGIRYTASTGIWQTVWLEPVPSASIQALKITPNVAKRAVTIEVDCGNASNALTVEVEVLDSDEVVARGRGSTSQSLTVQLPEAKLWSPSKPYLYDLRVRLLDNGDPIDEVASYFGMRAISLGKDRNGITRIMLNGEPLFQYGPLDQGYWPDGLYTPPSDRAVREELELVKKLGFNMVRKHVKVEPARWYYWCDRLGLLVWQDMPSGDRKAPWPQDGIEIERSAESAAQFRTELAAMIDFAYNHPSVVVWIPFNEAWGQFDTVEVTGWVKTRDPSRLVVSASGGNDFGVGDLKDDHFYPGPGAPPAEKNRAAVLGDKLLSRTRMDALDCYPFSEWTVEASFAFADPINSTPQVLLCKKGRFPGMPNPPLQLGVFEPKGQIRLQIVDKSENVRTVESRTVVQPGVWYHLAATCDGKLLRLFIKCDHSADYTLAGECEVDGALATTIGNWSLGRGYFNGKIDCDARALIDEVRISVTARPREEFLFSPHYSATQSN